MIDYKDFIILRAAIMRLKGEARDEAEKEALRALKPLVTNGGVNVSPHAVGNLAGDVTGLIGTTVVERINGVIIDNTPTNLSDILVVTDLSPLTATWMPNAGAGLEPLTNGDPDFPEIVFLDGDIVMVSI